MSPDPTPPDAGPDDIDEHDLRTPSERLVDRLLIVLAVVAILCAVALGARWDEP